MRTKQIRFPPDGDEVAFISFDKTQFKKDLSALIINESGSGACLVVNLIILKKYNPLAVGEVFLVKIGHMAITKAEIKWIREVDAQLCKIGIELFE